MLMYIEYMINVWLNVLLYWFVLLKIKIFCCKFVIFDLKFYILGKIFN